MGSSSHSLRVRPLFNNDKFHPAVLRSSRRGRIAGNRFARSVSGDFEMAWINALLNQVREFDEAVKLDGIILTKLDADAKGGNTLSILSETNVPVLFFGTGEAYDAIMSYRPEFILDSLVPNN